MLLKGCEQVLLWFQTGVGSDRYTEASQKPLQSTGKGVIENWVTAVAGSVGTARFWVKIQMTGGKFRA